MLKHDPVSITAAQAPVLKHSGDYASIYAEADKLACDSALSVSQGMVHNVDHELSRRTAHA